MEQSLIKSFCPDCEKEKFVLVKTILGWVKVVNKNELPDNLVEETCPSCTLNIINEAPLIVI